MIYKLERENTAQFIIKQLPRLWNKINSFAIQLKKIDRIYTTTEIMAMRTGFLIHYNAMNDFNTVHGGWFSSRYPEFATALASAIISLQNLNTIIMDGLHNFYWDTELDKPVIMEISQVHRDSLANSIETELE